MPTRAAAPPMVPPTIAPVCLLPSSLALVAGAEVSVAVLDDDDESLVELGSGVVVGGVMVSVVRDDSEAAIE